MAIVKKVDFRYQEQTHTADLPEEAVKVLEVLDDLEDFTISVRKKIIAEIRSTSKLIHVKLDSVRIILIIVTINFMQDSNSCCYNS